MPDPCVPTLEMLWENGDPARVLAERFGFIDGVAAARWVMAMMNDLWDVQVVACQRVVMSDCNALAWVGTASGPMLAKWSVAKDRFPRLAELACLVAWLDEQGLPVSAPVAARDGRVQIEVAGVSLSVQCVVSGELLDVAALDQVHEAGAVLARLHDALASYPRVDQIGGVLGSPEPVARRVSTWLEVAPDHVPEVTVDRLRRLVATAPTGSMSTQLIHGDFRAANLLCVDSRVAAVIDFEEARLDSPIAELARSAVLLGTRFHDWGPVSASVRKALVDGYQSVRKLTPVEAEWLPLLVLWYSVLMIPAGEDPTGWESEALAMLHESDESV